MNKNQFHENQFHGYWEVYHTNGKLYYKGHYKNGKRIGLWVWCRNDGTLWSKEYGNHNHNIEGIAIDE